MVFCKKCNKEVEDDRYSKKNCMCKDLGNCVPCCTSCNASKGQKVLHEWRIEIVSTVEHYLRESL